MGWQWNRQPNQRKFSQRLAAFLALLFLTIGLFSSELKPGVDLEIETNNALNLNAYYYAGSENNYPYDEAHRTSYYPLEVGRQTVYIPLKWEDMRYLRFDFGEVPAEISIYCVKIKKSPFENYCIEGNEITKIFNAQNCISSVALTGEAVTYMTTGVDGFIAAQADVFSQLGKPQISFANLCRWGGIMLLLVLLCFTSIPGRIVKFADLRLQIICKYASEKDTELRKRFRHFHQNMICVGCTIVCMALLWAGPQYIMLNLMYAFGIGLCISAIWENTKTLGKVEQKDLAVLAALAAVVTLPLMLTTFYYGDDYWGFNPAKKGYDYAGGIAFRRPLLGPEGQLVRNFDYRQLNIRRAGMVIILVLSVILIYELILRYHKSRKVAFSVSLLFTAGTFAIDSIAYMATSPILWGILFSLCAFEYYERAQGEGKWNYLIFALLLMCGFYFYQIATPILFVAFLVTLYDSKEKESRQFKKAFKILIFYGTVAISYLLSTKFLLSFYQIAAVQSARSKTSIDPAFYMAKAKWFLQTVLPQSIYKIWAVLLGKGRFTTNNLFYTIEAKSQRLGDLVTIFTLICIGVYLLRFFLRRRYATIFVALVGIPLSFYPFLILPESTALSYYMIPLILLLAYYSMSGFWILWNGAIAYWPVLKSMGKRILTVGCALTVIVAATRGSAYANNWVNFSRDAYMFLKQSIAQEINKDTKTIMVFGTLGPYVGGNPYVVFAVQRVLSEMEIDYTQYRILQADEAEYIATLPESTMTNIIQPKLSTEEFKRFQSFYNFDVMYRQYWFAHSANKEDLEFLQQCLQKAKLLVLEPSETEIVISLEGFKKTHVW